ANAASPWMLDFMGGFATDDPGVSPVGVDSAGYLLPQTAPPATDPTKVHALLAGYWREAKRTAKVPVSSVFAPGIWTTDFGEKLTRYHQGDVAENGLIGFYAYQT